MLILKFALLYLTVSAGIAREIFGRYNKPALRGIARNHGPRCRNVKPELAKGRCARRRNVRILRLKTRNADYDQFNGQ